MAFISSSSPQINKNNNLPIITTTTTAPLTNLIPTAIYIGNNNNNNNNNHNYNHNHNLNQQQNQQMLVQNINNMNNITPCINKINYININNNGIPLHFSLVSIFIIFIYLCLLNMWFTGKDRDNSFTLNIYTLLFFFIFFVFFFGFVFIQQQIRCHLQHHLLLHQYQIQQIT